jgi:hypothetical protein
MFYANSFARGILLTFTKGGRRQETNIYMFTLKRESIFVAHCDVKSAHTLSHFLFFASTNLLFLLRRFSQE